MSAIRAGKKRSTQRGRPRKGAASVEIEMIIETGLELARTLPLSEISIVRVAKEIGVTPASIHYYVKVRENLSLAITDRWFSGLLKNWPAENEDWQAYVAAVAYTIYRHCIAYPGIASHLASQNRFRLAISISDTCDAPHMVQFLDRLFATVLQSGLTGKTAAMFAFELSQFVHGAAHASASHQIPGEQSRFRQLLQLTDSTQFPSIAALRDDYARLTGDEVFREGLRHIIDSYATAAKGPGGSTAHG